MEGSRTPYFKLPVKAFKIVIARKLHLLVHLDENPVFVAVTVPNLTLNTQLRTAGAKSLALVHNGAR